MFIPVEKFKLTIAVCLSAVLASCNATSNVFSRASLASEAQTSLIGKSKGQILACMGSPIRTASADNVDVLTFASGDGTTQSLGTASVYGSPGSAVAFGSSHTVTRSCEVDIVFEGGRVSRVNYKGRTGGLITQGEQCAYAVSNCVAG